MQCADDFAMFTVKATLTVVSRQKVAISFILSSVSFMFQNQPEFTFDKSKNNNKLNFITS